MNDRRQSDSLEHEEMVLKLEARVPESCALRQLLEAGERAAIPVQTETELNLKVFHEI